MVLDHSKGWAPLCAFLGKPIPAVPYPHVNSKTDFDAFINTLTGAVFGGILLLAAAAVFLVRFLVRALGAKAKLDTKAA